LAYRRQREQRTRLIDLDKEINDSLDEIFAEVQQYDEQHREQQQQQGNT